MAGSSVAFAPDLRMLDRLHTASNQNPAGKSGFTIV
jgi:hypothetical protein